MTPQLAYDLLSRADDPQVKEILENDIVMLWPTMNPDGQQMVGEWLLKNAGTPYEQSGLPRLYQEYVGHDNNRDAYMINMIESRVMEHFWRQWEPHIIYVFHQTAPFPTRIWLPPFSEPVGLDAPYLASREVNMIGMAIAKGLEERGQVGRHAHGHVLRRLVSRLRRLRADLQEHPGILDGDGRQHGGPARVRHQRYPAELPRSPAAEPILQPMARGLVAPGRRRRL